MEFNNNSVFSSLLNSKLIRLVENEFSERVTPILDKQPLQNIPDEIYQGRDYEAVELWMNDKSKSENAQFFPLSLKCSIDKGEWFLLPWEPLISIQGNIRQNQAPPAQHIGTIKDRRLVDDYEITISGAFYGKKIKGAYSETYPRRDMEKLRNYLMSPEAIEVKCELLQLLNINKIAITGMSFPFTKGESVQAYEIRAKSDFPWDLNYKRKSKPTLEVGMPTGEFIKPSE
ncbi:hypothetical protein SAMN05421796_11070 [Chryseobacterium piscicola]|uniref:DUF6046 domain-containing protein n=1 Tax=Chryseobacterium piscicola TaxID=551459 RepID=A0A1N7P151_9FLAO|nr:DUF6046 domain-containing protein [Chryseobacterium piscicola]PQA92746.1 hypothetical protein B0A70_10195 [Chryseobacterium piscicola]SIT04375.1 hypothetical protein SAMN05421796_11070 [Chryseobacterium piscicola]